MRNRYVGTNCHSMASSTLKSFEKGRTFFIHVRLPLKFTLHSEEHKSVKLESYFTAEFINFDKGHIETLLFEPCLALLDTRV